MILDFHTHCFPDALAPRALGALIQNGASMALQPNTDGTARGLTRLMSRVGIDRAVVCNIATHPRQTDKVNAFAVETLQQYPSLIPLGSLHPQSERPEEVLDGLISHGIRGIKIHPDYMGTDLDDPAFEPVLSLCEEKGVFVVTHAGLDPLSPDHIHCTPAMVRRVTEAFPRLKLVVAHMGGLACEEDTLHLLCGRDVYLDTSLLTYRPDKEEILKQIVTHHRPDRLLFATDTPWTHADGELAAIRRLTPTDDLLQRILWQNATRLLASVSYGEV